MYSSSVGLNASVLQSVLLVFVIFSLDFAIQEDIPSEPLKLNMAFFIPANTTEAMANHTAGAILVALKTINRRQTLLRGFDIDWRVYDPQCSTTLAVKKLFSLVREDESDFYPHVIFGGYCERVCDILAGLSVRVDVPFFAIDCKGNSLHNHVIHPTYLPFDYDRASAIPVIIALMKSFGWKRLAILTAHDANNYELALQVKNEVEANENWRAILFFTMLSVVPEGFASPEADEEVKVVFDDIKRQARIVFLALDKLHAARILIMAKRHGMHNGQYAFIGYDINTISAALLNASEGEWKEANVGFVYMELTNVYAQLEDHQFVHLINKQDFRATKEFQLKWIKQQTLKSKEEMLVRSAGDLYMAMRVYAYLVNRTLAMSGITHPGYTDPTADVVYNGTLLLSMIAEHSINATKNLTSVDENLGMLRFDKFGKRIPRWLLKNSHHQFDVVHIFSYDKVGEEVNERFEKEKFLWPGKTTQVPLDEPECGFHNEKCLRDLKYLILVYTCPVLGVLVFAGVFIAIYFLRRSRNEAEKRILAEWQVKWSKIVVLGDSVVGRILGDDLGRSKTSFETGSQIVTGDMRSVNRSTTNRLYTLAGTYKGKVFAIKKINRDTINIFQPAIFHELKKLFYISHVNVNPFIGVCSEAPNVCVLMLYADRGSLQDVLAEPKYDINWEFRMCLATDVAKGMAYLHDSPIGPHGHLMSANCVVDRKWECRITDYGLQQFKRSRNQEISTFKWNSNLLWTAPEILKKPETDRDRTYGTKEGDVYSFGIIVCELITKELPYHIDLESISPEEVVLNVKSDPQFRPRLPKPEGPIGAGWNSLATICWHQQPEVRPNFVSIQGKLRSINGGKIPNLMDRTQNMMEEALQHKAVEMAAERKRTEKVVYNLLPQSIAAEIISGKEIRPQLFESITLCFCETTDIFETSKAMSPIQVAEILMSLIGSFDKVMKSHNVIEIDGRGSKDTMILASGLPQYTGKHAEDVCDMCLDLIVEVLAFKTPLAPDVHPNLKISIHSGPVLTTVIWRTLPRYSINGEAVDTVVAMQSSSKAMRVRISKATYKQVIRSGGFTFEQGGNVAVKDRKPIKTYWLTGKTGYRKSLPPSMKRRSSSLKGQELEGRKSK